MTILEKEFVELKGYFRTFFERKKTMFSGINIFQECVLEAQDLDDGGFSSEYQARLTEDYEGEKERTNHEENINKRHDYLKIRLDKANAVRTKHI